MEAARKCFEAIDQNGNGVIDYSEFVCLISQNIMLGSEEMVKKIFDELDLNKDGRISEQELQHKLGKEMPTSSIRQMISEMDTNQDGHIDYTPLAFSISRIS